MKKGFLINDRDNSHANDENAGANLPAVLEFAASLGVQINEEKSTTRGLIFDPSWMNQDSTPESGQTPQTSAPTSEPQNAVPDSPMTSGPGNSEGATHPGDWEGRQARCRDVVQKVDRTMAVAAATAYLSGTSFLGGYADEKNLILSDAYFGEKPEKASKPGDWHPQAPRKG